MVTKESINTEPLALELAKAKNRINELENTILMLQQSKTNSPANYGYEWAQNELRNSKDRFRNVLDASPIPYALNDEQQNIVYLNPAFINTFGYTLNDISTLNEWWPKAYPDKTYRDWAKKTWQEHLSAAITQATSFVPFEISICCKDGSQRTVIAGASPLSEEFKGIHLVTLYDITQQKLSETKLNDTLILLENVLNSTPDLIFVKNNELQTILCNQAHASAVGKTREEMYGYTDIENGWDPELVNGNPDKNIRGFIHDDLAALSGKNIHNPYDPANVDGEIRVFDTHKLPLRDHNNKIIGVLGIARDITVRQRAEQELEQHRDRLETMVTERTTALEEANQELKSFSYSVSHDLRAPLRIIQGFSEVLIEDYAEQLDDDAKSYLNRISKNVKHMSLLIGDMLSLAKVTNSEINLKSVNLSSLAEKIINVLQQTDPQRDVHLDIQANIECVADTRLLGIVLENLLGNAWKYTGTVKTAKIRFFSREENNEVVYRITDNGVGFNMENAGKLFGAFQRMHNNDEFEGTGIGLATVARIIRRHGGRVWADAELGKGTTISFTLGPANRLK